MHDGRRLWALPAVRFGLHAAESQLAGHRPLHDRRWLWPLSAVRRGTKAEGATSEVTRVLRRTHDDSPRGNPRGGTAVTAFLVARREAMTPNRMVQAGVLGGFLVCCVPVAAQINEREHGQENRNESEQFKAGVDVAVRMLGGHPRLEGLSDQQRRDLFEFAIGNTLFALAHEIGHAAISEMGLPVLGREEDAADAYAVLGMLRMGTAVSDRVLTSAATGWFLSDRRNRKEGIKQTFYDEHGLDQQRAYEIVCLMVGSDPVRFRKAAEMAGMPESRQETCKGDYSNASWSWSTELKPHLRTADQPKQRIDAVYGPAEGSYEVFSQAFRAFGLLETAADHVALRYVWRRPITLEMQTCGTPLGRWNLSSQKVTISYELAADFAMLYRDYGLTAMGDLGSRE